MKTCAAFLLTVVACVAADLPYTFSDGYLEVLGGEPQQAFTCEGRPYGYYADVASACQVFHVCVPLSDHAGDLIQTSQYSFFCGNQTVFDQSTLTCAHPEYAYPCDQAEGYYDIVNAEFGRIPENNRDYDDSRDYDDVAV